MGEKFENIWDALFDDPGEKTVLEIKSKLMSTLKIKRKIHEIDIEYLIKEAINSDFIIEIKLTKDKKNEGFL